MFSYIKEKFNNFVHNCVVRDCYVIAIDYVILKKIELPKYFSSNEREYYRNNNDIISAILKLEQDKSITELSINQTGFTDVLRYITESNMNFYIKYWCCQTEYAEYTHNTAGLFSAVFDNCITIFLLIDEKDSVAQLKLVNDKFYDKMKKVKWPVLFGRLIF